MAAGSSSSHVHAHSHPHTNGGGLGGSLLGQMQMQMQAQGGTGQRIVSPVTFFVVLGVIMVFLVLSQPRADGPGLTFRQFHLKDDGDVEASRQYDSDAMVARLDLTSAQQQDPRQDHRGWMLDPLAAAEKAGLQGGSTSCLEVHLGEILPSKSRGNHRHNNANETIVLWGAKMLIRNENPNVAKGFTEVVLGYRDVAVMVSPARYAHYVANIDNGGRIGYIFACQDAKHDPQLSEYHVWGDLN